MKRISRIALASASLGLAACSSTGGGYGGYNQDHEFFGYRQSI